MSRPSVLEVAVYDAELLVAVGKVDEVAEELGIKPETIRWYLAPTYQRRLAKRNTLSRSRTVVRLDDEEESDCAHCRACDKSINLDTDQWLVSGDATYCAACT